MDKRESLKSGEEVMLTEKITEWNGHQEYYRVQREDGSINIIEVSKFNQLVQKSVNNKRSTTEKLELFYSYFQGREDVYATKWISKSGKTGFSPHGDGTWINKDGKYRKEIHTYYPYTIQTVNDHIRAEKAEFKMGAGIYPMLENDQTRLVVIDFDKDNAIEEAKAVVKVCRKNDIDVLIERSQSGDGIHLWFFFQDEISAATARYFAQMIIRQAMAELEVVQFQSFDRIIPMQDTLPTNSLGNIIALPLRADKVKENKTVFLDDNFEVVDDLWDTLAGTIKYTEAEITSYIRMFKESLPVQYYKNDNSNVNIHLPDKLIVEEAGELVIGKSQISKKNLVQLAHLATFHNPEFYKKQNMRVPTWDTPQFITSASEDEENLYLPRGLKSKLEQFNTDIEFIDGLNEGHFIDITFKGKLRDNQKNAVKTILKHHTGIISAPTGFGKTVVTANVIAERKVSTLIIVHSTVLAEQWKERLSEFLEIKSEPFTEHTPTGRIRKKDKIGELHSGKENLSHNIDIALYQSLVGKEDLENYLDPYGMVIVDEVHHVGAQTFEDVVKTINSRYLYGLTATPNRKDGLTPILFMRFGEMIVEEKEGVEEHLLIPKYFYPRFTNYSDLNPELGYQQHLNNMVNIEDRNAQIVSDVIANINEQRTCLVLTERVSHTVVLKQIIEEKLLDTNVYVLTSEEKDRENKENIEKMKSSKDPFVVIGTSKKVGEGFDLLKLESVFFTLPFSWKDRTTQYVGRLHRGLSEKDELRVYDYVDIGVEMFGRMYQKRMKVYNKLNYRLAEDDKTRKNQTQLYNTQTYEKALQFDLSKAKKLVIGIVSVRQLVNGKLAELHKAGLEIEILVKRDMLKKRPELAQELVKMNIKITQLDTHPFSFIVCDEKLIWYGNINFGAHTTAEGTALRLLNVEVAVKMLRQYG